MDAYEEGYEIGWVEYWTDSPILPDCTDEEYKAGYAAGWEARNVAKAEAKNNW